MAAVMGEWLQTGSGIDQINANSKDNFILPEEEVTNI